MRPKKWAWVLTVTILLGVGTAVWATTHHSINMLGSTLDFTTDEKLAGDPAGDSTYGVNNDLTTLYLTWDANKLYVGFAYAAWESSVIYLIDAGKPGGVGDLRKGQYNGAFPANIQGPQFDIMIAMWLPPDIIKQPTPHIYLLGNKTSVEITGFSGVDKSMKDVGLPKSDPKGPVHTGVVKVAIPWSTICGLGTGKVPAGARLKVAGVVRGKQDGDGVGDVSPDPTGKLNTTATGTPTKLDKFHQVLVDGDCDGLPDKGCKPRDNTCPGGTGSPCPTKKDAGPPPADSKAWPDTKPAADSKAWPDTTPAADTQAWPDTKLAADSKAGADKGKEKDLKVVKQDAKAADGPQTKQDSKVTSADKSGPAPDVKDTVVDAIYAEGGGGDKGVSNSVQSEDGCACSAQGSQSMSMGLMGLGLLVLVGIGRGGRRRKQ